MPASFRESVHFFFLAWSSLQTDRANSVMILKTCEALARLEPSWIVDLRFTHLPPEGPDEALQMLGIERPPNLRIGTLFPSRSFLPEREISHVLMGSEGKQALRQRAEWEACWRRELKGDRPVVYTRNVPLLEFFANLAAEPRVPLLLELHQLKYTGRAQSALDQDRMPGAIPPSPGRARDLLRHLRNEEARAIARADLVFCISGPLAERVRRMTGNAVPVRLLRSAVGLPETGPTPGTPPDRDLDLLYTGQLYYWKGVHTVIEALRHCRDDVRLTVVGGNNRYDLNYARRLARNLGVDGRIDWVGQVPHRQVLDFQQRAKIGVVPLPRGHRISRWYTSPVKVFEMMAAGLPLLVSDLPSLRDILDPDETAAFAPPDDPRGWGKAIDALLADPEKREALATQARRKIGEFTFTRRAEQIRSAVEEMVP